MIVNKSMYPVSSTLTTITKMQAQMSDLQTQLATGKKQTTLADFGQERVHDLNLRARLGRIEGYNSNIQTVENRLSFTNNALERLDEIEADTRKMAVPGAYGTDGLNLVNLGDRAKAMMGEVVDLLNTEVNGQYLFGGNETDKPPVADVETLLATFKDVLAQRKSEDGAGAGNMGRLAFNPTPPADGEVTLAEDGDHTFGFKIVGASASDGLGASPLEDGSTGGKETTFTFSDDIAAGETITIGLTLPPKGDETPPHYIELKAVTGEAGAGEFSIGDDAAETAQNFKSKLEGIVKDLAETDLASASAYAAADDYFAADPTADGTPDYMSADVPQWYTGQEGGDPRKAASAQIDETTKVNFGVQAQEKGFRELMKSLAVFSSQDFSMDGEPEENAAVAARYDATVGNVRTRLSETNNADKGSIEGITMELGLTSSTLNTVKERHTQYEAQLETMLGDIEEAPIEEVAMKILDTQNRLQASFQVTSMVRQLTLVNYL